MDMTTAQRIAKRFVTLPVDQRRQILDKLAASGQSFRLLPIVPASEGMERIPLSYAQQRLLFLWQLAPQSAAYNVPCAVRLRGALDEPALRASFKAMLARHEVLRTHFASDDGVFHQLIEAEPELPLVTVKVTEAELDEQVRAQFEEPFDLLTGPLLRIRLWRLAEDDHVLTLCMHHIISDGWSAEVMVREFAEGYAAALEARPANLPALPIQYADYALWQRAWLEAGEGERQLAYWKAQLGDEQPLLALPADHPRPAQPSHRGGQVHLTVDPQLAAGLKQLARQGGYTLFMLVLAAAGITLSRFSGQDDIRIGTPNAGRNRKEVEGLVGFFINTQVIRLGIDERQSFRQLLDQVRQNVAGAQSHQDLPFEQLVEALAPERSLAVNPLFQFKLNQNVGADATAEGPAQRLHGLEVSGHGAVEDEARFDLALDFTETENGIEGYFTYARDLFEAPTIERLNQAFGEVLSAMVRAPEQALLAQPVTPASAAPESPMAFPCADMLALWRQGLAAGGMGPALQQGERVLGYAQLDTESNRLAHYLSELGVLPGNVVGLCLERSIEWAVSWLAILKCGAACLPLDPAQPAQRLRQLARDSRAVRVIGEVPLDNALPYDSATWAHCAADAPTVQLHPAQPAYVIYTSGSTGQPKGVVISHGALADYVQGVQVHLQGAPGVSMALVSTPAADLGHTQLFGALASGSLLHLVPQDHAFDPDRFAAYMSEYRIDVLKLVPSHLQGLLQAAKAADVLPARLLVLGGERCDWALAERIRSLKPACRLLNHYGPTETTVGVLAHPLTEVLPGYDSVPLGAPLPNAQVQILDAWLQPVAEGVAGELYLGGPGVAQGYLGHAALTAERFVPAADGARCYRSGDRARLDRERIVFLGRNDDQVKIRGYRVELGELAQALRALEGVEEAVVQALPMDNDPSRLQLLAWCVAPGRTAQALKDDLLKRLPEALVPAQIVLIERLPVTSNGKLDKRALPMPGAQQADFVAPSGEAEETLARIWGEVLKVERVGAEDNFFELGGDSILSLQIIARAKRQGWKITPKQLFEAQTVARLAQLAKPIAAKPAAAAPVVNVRQGQVPLVPSQARFFDTEVVARHHWNQSILLTPHQALDDAALARALDAVVEQHDALNLAFSEQAGQWRAEFTRAEPANRLWRRKVGSFDELPALADEAQRSLDLARGELLRAVLFEDEAGAQRLLLIVHHLVVDGVSWRVLLEDLQAAYQQQPLAPRTTAIKEWAERLQGYAAAPALLAQREHWEQALDDGLSALLAKGDVVTVGEPLVTRLSNQQTQRLLKAAPAAYRTQVNDLLLAALAEAVRRFSGESAVSVMLEGHGREDLFDGLDLTRTLGWFTSLFPVRLSAGETLDATLKAVKEQLRATPERGVGYGVLRYLADPATQAALRNRPQPRLVFNYLGQFDGSFDRQQGSLFAPATEASGAARCPASPAAPVVSIDGQVYNGELSLSWSFSPELFDARAVQALAAHYQQALEAIIEHCASGVGSAITPSDVPLAGLSQAQLDRLTVPAAAIEDVYPLSPMQHGMLFHTLLGQDGEAYLNQMRVDVSGLDVERLRAAWQATVDAHDVLRSSFVSTEPHPVQVIRRELKVPLFEVDWRGQPDLLGTLDQWAREDRRAGFDLACGPLMRLTLIRITDDTWHMVYTSHHLLMDGWSSTRLQAEVLQRYAGLAVGAPTARYRDYIQWLGQQDVAADEAFWKAQIAPLAQPTRLGAASAGQQASTHGEHHQVFDAEVTARLEGFARQERVTLNTLVQSAWLLLLQAFTGEDCVAFGATVAGRPMGLPGIEEQLGLFINTLPVVAAPSPQTRVGEWLRAVQDQNLALREHEHSPLADIQRWAGHAGEALFDSLLVFENYPLAEALAQGAPGGLRFGALENQEQTNYPLTLVVGVGQVMGIRYAFDERYFDFARVERLAHCLHEVLHGLMADANRSIGTIALLDEVRQAERLADWNRADAWQAGHGCIHQCFEQQVVRTPHATALVCGDQRMTYQALERRANQVAHHLIALGVGPQVLVGIAVGRSLDMLVGLLAILKAGGAYVPLDPDYPAERLEHMIQDSGVSLVLTHMGLDAWLPLGLGVRGLLLEEAGRECSELPPPQRAVPGNLAYVIYTSGSTGRPKGAGVRHDSFVNLMAWFAGTCQLSAHDKVLLVSSYSFDLTQKNLFAILCAGGELHLPAPGYDPQAFRKAVASEGITVLNCAPSAFVPMLEPLDGSLDSLRHVLLGGEPVKAHELESWLRHPGNRARLHNSYGPTECTDVVIEEVLDAPQALARATMLTGRPVPGAAIQLLGANGQWAEAGMIGEIYIAGACVGEGYWRQPALTAERFVPDEWADGGRCYRTGDLARYDEQGVIDYVGRRDHQVKLRGLRIELGEIEARLRGCADVREAVVLALDSTIGAQLVAYVVPRAAAGDISARVRHEVAQGLPAFMVPNHWVLLEALPLNPNGKLDRKALPAPDLTIGRPVYEAPVTELGHSLAQMWSDVLKVDQVGLADDFFELGGHSLLVMQIIVRVRSQLGREIAMAELFECSRFGDFVDRLAAMAGQGDDLQDELTKSLEALKRLSKEEIDELTS